MSFVYYLSKNVTVKNKKGKNVKQKYNLSQKTFNFKPPFPPPL
ncbi:hypothetical protein SAN_2390, partial [Streptococcus agalactiae COH1]